MLYIQKVVCFLKNKDGKVMFLQTKFSIVSHHHMALYLFSLFYYISVFLSLYIRGLARSKGFS